MDDILSSLSARLDADTFERNLHLIYEFILHSFYQFITIDMHVRTEFYDIHRKELKSDCDILFLFVA